RRDTYPDDAQNDALRRASGVDNLGAIDRATLVARVLEKPDGLLALLSETHDVRRFRFWRKPMPISSLDELTARGVSTQIGDALDLHLAAAGSVNVDAVILVSDGRNTDGASPQEIAAKYRIADIPIYTIGVSDPNPPHNTWIIAPSGPKEALRGEEVAFEAILRNEGLEGVPVTVTLSASRDGGPFLTLQTDNVTLGDSEDATPVRLYHPFEEAGDYNLRFEVSSPQPETTLEDNRDTRFLRVNDEKILVLYVADLPTWQYRYAKNGLKRVDKSIEMQAFLFDASANFVQERSDTLNPLLDLPRTREALFEYHVILIGDVAPERLAPTQQGVHEWLQWLTEFVEFGGGVGFLSGPLAMPERYRHTPLEDLLPVVLEDPLELQYPPDWSRMFVPQLENPRLPHDISLLLRDPGTNAQLWHRGFEGMYGYQQVKQAKAGAQVILHHPTAENAYGKRVIAVASYYPRGRTFFLGTDETWRWRNPYGEKHLDNFWRNVVRYLAGGRLERRDDRLALTVDKRLLDTGEKLRVSLSVQDEEFSPEFAENYTVFLRPAEGPPEPRTLRSVTGEPGSFEASFTMPDPGAVSILVHENDNPADRVLAREDVLVRIPEREMARSSQDRQTLEEVARATEEGRYFFLAQAEELLQEFSDRTPFEREVDKKTRPAWDNIWTLLALLTVLGGEWILRKRARLI
ncbi:MAG: VWA domain-containing protein, partial [Longimicrobiales bacterium]